MRNHLLTRYFVRIAGSFLLVLALVVGGIYAYYTRQAKAALQERIDSYLSPFRQLAEVEDKAAWREGFSRRVRGLAEASGAMFLEVWGGEGTRLFHWQKEGFSLPEIPERIRRFPDMGESISAVVWYKERFFLVFVSTQGLHGKPRYIRGVIPLEKELAVGLEEDLEAAFLIVALTAFVIAVVVFPLIWVSYRQLETRRKALVHSNLGTVEALGNAIAQRDSDTHEHNYRVTWYALKLAEALGLPKERMGGLIIGAFLHDVGKIGIPDAILLKPGKLDDGEFAIMQTHVELGLEIVEGLSWLEEGRSVIAGHHEKFDGSGYPRGLAGEAIALEARIFAVADVFDALCSRRPYKEAFPVERGIAIVQEAIGGHFDPAVAEPFLHLAEGLHARVAQMEINALREKVLRAIAPYFG